MPKGAFLHPPTAPREFGKKAVLIEWQIGQMFGVHVVRGTVVDGGVCLPFHAEVWATQSNYPDGPRTFWTNRGPVRANMRGIWG